LITLLYAEKWRCRPSVADNEPAVWALRQGLLDSYRTTYNAPLPITDEDF